MHTGAHSVALLLLVPWAGCGDGIVAQGQVQTGGASTALAFLDADVVVASPSRGEVEVLAENADHTFRNVGAFYTGGVAEDLAVGHVGGRGAVAVRDQGGSVTLLGAAADMPHRLDFPVQIYRRVRNGQPFDDSPPSTAIALAELDGDGSDELVAATSQGVFVVTHLDKVLGTNPEKPPAPSGFRLDAGPEPVAVAALDVDGDGRLDLVVLDGQDPTLLVYHKHGPGAGDFDPPAAIALPSTGKQVVAAACPGLPARVLLADGRVVALSPDGRIVPSLPAEPPAESLVATRDALAVAATGGIKLYDACTRIGIGLDVVGSGWSRLAMAAPSGVSYHPMAVLGADRQTVSMYRVFTGF